VPEAVICILGMHRSGTSCLTGSLQDAGLHLGKHHTWNPHNLKGNRENQDVVDLNDQILAANDGAWDNPPANVCWRESDRVSARELLDSYSDQPNLGFKDPRTLLVLEGWHELLPEMHRVGIFRHPNAVAKSLEIRSEMPRGQALELWYKYNKRLCAEYKRSAFPILCFDDPEDVFHAKLDQVAQEVGLNPEQGGERFYVNDLKQSEQSGEVLPWRVGRLYRRLCSYAR
jgi:hypothetical protein